MVPICVISAKSCQDVSESCCVLRTTMLLAKVVLTYGDRERWAIVRSLMFCYATSGTAKKSTTHKYAVIYLAFKKYLGVSHATSRFDTYSG